MKQISKQIFEMQKLKYESGVFLLTAEKQINLYNIRSDTINFSWIIVEAYGKEQFWGCFFFK